MVIEQARFAVVGWSADDVRAALLSTGRAMSLEQCERFLESIAPNIEDKMVAAGWEVLEKELLKHLERSKEVD